jgi:two-component system response regulator VanR
MASKKRRYVVGKAKSRVRILLVDDQEALASVLAAFLNQQGYDVVWARDGEQARREMADGTFHLVITDSVLPHGSGWEVASDAKRRGLPVILSSGWPVRLRSSQLASRGVDFLCPKPFAPAELHRLIRQALRHAPGKAPRRSLVPKAQYQSHR